MTLVLPLRGMDEAWLRLRDLRATYVARLQQLIDYVNAAHELWGQSSEPTVAPVGAEARSCFRAIR